MKTKDKPKRRLLLVDDDATVLSCLETALRGRFDVVARCTSGEEALEVVTALPPVRRPDLVLLDIKMPGMGGIACCRELRKLFPKLLIAMHTAKEVHERFEEARLAGADAYIVKSCLPSEKLAATLLQLKRREGQCLCVAGTHTIKPATNHLNLLTTRETEVISFISQAGRYKQAADHFGCSESNIKKTVARAIRHLEARSRDHAIRLWLEAVTGVPKDIFPAPADSATNLENP